MKKVRLALAGIGGYGASYLRFLSEFTDPESYEWTAAIDPFAEQLSALPWLQERGIRIYHTLEEFYQADSAELMILSTPISLHKEQAVYAMEHGSHVLCEKPLAATLQDAAEMRETAARCNRLLGVGFQWSFCKPMLDLKRDILRGDLGRPLELKAYISWMRFNNYYQTSPWKGRVRDSRGNWILDSVSTNATAHYLHNLFFMMGGRLESTQMPQSVRVGMYRAKDIQSFDTCFIKGEYQGGFPFYLVATHSGDTQHEPILQYTFENAVVTLNEEPDNRRLTATFKDGSIRDYGDPLSTESAAAKVGAMIAAVRGEGIVTCPAECVLPHLMVSNAMFDQIEISEFPQSLRFETDAPQGVFVRDLSAQCQACYEQMRLPSELGYRWAVPETALQLDGYAQFCGSRYLKHAEI